MSDMLGIIMARAEEDSPEPATISVSALVKAEEEERDAIG